MSGICNKTMAKALSSSKAQQSTRPNRTKPSQPTIPMHTEFSAQIIVGHFEPKIGAAHTHTIYLRSFKMCEWVFSCDAFFPFNFVQWCNTTTTTTEMHFHIHARPIDHGLCALAFALSHSSLSVSAPLQLHLFPSRSFRFALFRLRLRAKFIREVNT